MSYNSTPYYSDNPAMQNTQNCIIDNGDWYRQLGGFRPTPVCTHYNTTVGNPSQAYEARALLEAALVKGMPEETRDELIRKALKKLQELR